MAPKIGEERNFYDDDVSKAYSRKSCVLQLIARDPTQGEMNSSRVPALNACLKGKGTALTQWVPKIHVRVVSIPVPRVALLNFGI